MHQILALNSGGNAPTIYWLIVGASAPTAPPFPTPMNFNQHTSVLLTVVVSNFTKADEYLTLPEMTWRILGARYLNCTFT